MSVRLEKRLAALLDDLAKHKRMSVDSCLEEIDYALQVFNNAPHIRTVADVCREMRWSRRWFGHAFGEQVGMTPKRYCRLMCFQRVVRQIASDQPVDWVDVALASGFCDQAHMVHEFRAFSGLSPERYLTAEQPLPNHVRTD